MDLSDLSPEAQDMLHTYASRPEFKGDKKLALETMIRNTTQAYKKVAQEWREARAKRLAKQEEEFNKTHSGFRKHKNFGY